jgi:flavodoxin
MKALIIYHSKKGTTKNFALEIQKYLEGINMQSTVSSINEFRTEDLQGADLILLGCWTHGLMIFGQHPDKEWVAFAKKLPSLSNIKTGFFTTYKLATGSMFRSMRKHLKLASNSNFLELKSRNGQLKDLNPYLLDLFVK